jgi:hypothetical protein
MADLRVFVSSTCYDLAILREQLRAFLLGAGHQPVMSDYSDVLYDHRNHTHTSCVREVAGCDIAVVVVGGRFGGAAVPEALSHVDFEKLRAASGSPWTVEQGQSVSITQLEVLRAIQDSIPVFAFVDEQVWHDHLVYEKNKGNPILSGISFPSIDKPETGKYIFEFINFLRHRPHNNSIQRFARFEDIISHLRRQWSALFQRLLLEQRQAFREARATAQIAEQLESLKAAVLTSIKEPGLRDTARGVVRYRRVVDFVTNLKLTNPLDAIRSGVSMQDVLQRAQVVKAFELARSADVRGTRTFLMKSDGTMLMFRMPPRMLRGIAVQWVEFVKLPVQSREAIFEAWEGMSGHLTMFVTTNRTAEEWAAEGELREVPVEQVFSETEDADGTA